MSITLLPAKAGRPNKGIQNFIEMVPTQKDFEKYKIFRLLNDNREIITHQQLFIGGKGCYPVIINFFI